MSQGYIQIDVRRRGVADTDGDSTYVAAAELTRWAARVLTRAGLTRSAARHLADILVRTDASGVPTHGIVLLPRFVGALGRGELNPRPHVHVVASRSAAAHVDGDNGAGQLVAWTAMARAIHMARRAGVGLVTLSNNNHFGAASTYVEQAAESGCWGLAVSNSSARVAPVGGREALLGTSPIALAALGLDADRMVLDFSTAAIARGKVREAAREGRALPDGVAQDVDGHPTTDAARAMDGLLLPMGGPRGLALGLFVELLAILGGARLATDISQSDEGWGGLDIGQTFVAIDPAAFGAPGALQEQVSRLLGNTRRLAGRAPGDRRHTARERAQTEGVRLSRLIYQQLLTVSRETAVPILF
jgi:L-2-hydroxycarboxylate dehydrogenase (NAD+)